MMERVLNRVKPLGWHLVIHVNAEDIISFQEFFLKFDMDIIVDHMGRVPTSHGVNQPAFQILKQFVERENWWVKICGSERISAAGPPFMMQSPMHRNWLRLRLTAFYGERTGRIPISNAICRMTAICLIWCLYWLAMKHYRKKYWSIIRLGSMGLKHYKTGLFNRRQH